jgi:hypothetical protein
MVFSKPRQGFKVEITSAMHESELEEMEIVGLSESFLKECHLSPDESSFYALPNGPNCLHTVCSDQNEVIVVAWVYWSRFCVEIKLVGQQDQGIESAVLGVKQILRTLEPLV